LNLFEHYFALNGVALKAPRSRSAIPAMSFDCGSAQDETFQLFVEVMYV